MKRAWLRAFSVAAALAISCGPGDHARAGFGDLFGRGSGGKTAPARARGENGADNVTNSAAGKAAAFGPTVAAGSAAGVVRVGSGAGGTDGLSAGSAGRDAGSFEGSATAGASSVDAARGATSTGGSRGTAALNDAGPSASCGSGYLAVEGACVCDMNGTFAFHGRAQVSLPSMAPVEALNDTIELWGTVRQTYDGDGNLGLMLSACGQTTPDICVAAQAPVLPNAEAYAQYVPVEVWDKHGTQAALQIGLPGALPGTPFETPTLAELFGVTLANPLGAWPTTRKDVEGGSEFDGSAVNGAHWLDIDGDGELGMSIKLVPPGGVAAAATSGPPHSYAATSTKCPRSDPQAARSPYAYLPLPQGLGVKRIKRLYSAQRIALEFHGTLASCDRVSGMLTGANGGALHMDSLIGGCAIVNGSGESTCTAALLDMTDSGGGAAAGLQLGSGSFVLARVADAVTCAQVRAMNLE
jgi:hypothetical protein